MGYLTDQASFVWCDLRWEHANGCAWNHEHSQLLPRSRVDIIGMNLCVVTDQGSHNHVKITQQCKYLELYLPIPVRPKTPNPEKIGASHQKAWKGILKTIFSVLLTFFWMFLCCQPAAGGQFCGFTLAKTIFLHKNIVWNYFLKVYLEKIFGRSSAEKILKFSLEKY